MSTTMCDSVGCHRDIIRAVAAHGLPGSMLDFPSQALDPSAFADLLGNVKMQRISGLLWRSIVDEALPVTAEQADQAEWLHVRSLSASLALERLLIGTLESLRAEGVPVRVLKGTAVGHLDYPDPGLRTFGDIDLMVPGNRFDVAAACLEGQGHRRSYPQPRPGFDRRFSKGASFRTAEGLEIDLHRTFAMGPFGVRLDLEMLWETSATFEIAGHTVEALSAEERFFHACYHAVLGEVRPKLVPLRDAAQIALTRRLDLGRLHGLIRASHGEAVVARAVRYAWSEFEIADITAISAWAHAYRTDPREAADLAVYGLGTSYARRSVAALRSLPTMTQRAAYLYAMLLPTSGYLGRRHQGRLDRLRTGLRQSVERGQA